MIVIDANAAVEIALDSDLGRELRAVVADEEITAPALFIDEAANTVWKYERAYQLSKKQSFDMFRVIVSIVDRFVGDDELYPEALSAAIQDNHPVYDMLYLVLARRNNAALYTRDKKLAKICRENDVDCISLVELGSSAK